MNENKRFTVFVGNRIAEIREKSELNQWRHCPGEENPCDDASRGLSPSQLTTDCRWLNGPSFLKDAESAWPKTSLGNLEDDDYSGEDEIQRSMVIGIYIPVLHQLLERYSTWSLLREKVVWLTRFKFFLCSRISSLYSCPRVKPSSEELRTAENDILRLVQRHVYAEEYQHLSEGNEFVKSSSNIAKLSQFIGEDSLIRVGSRLENAPLSYDAKFPPIIPKQHWIAELMARDVHHNNAHSGQEHTLNLLRQRVWIFHARSLVRKIINKCFVCRKGNAPTLTQKMSPLPSCRLMAYEPPFSYVGADMFGPLFVKQGRSNPKRSGCIFTCMSTRAIHLEVAPSLETDDFVNVLRLFVARRCTPKEIRKDCGTNFRGAENKLKKAITHWNYNQLNDKLSQRGIKWIFHPPYAPHFAGLWERLIKDVKRSLKAILRGSLVTDHVLRQYLPKSNQFSFPVR